MTVDKRNASDFIVRARWTLMEVCEQTEERKNRMETKAISKYGCGLERGEWNRHFYS